MGNVLTILLPSSMSELFTQPTKVSVKCAQKGALSSKDLIMMGVQLRLLVNIYHIPCQYASKTKKSK